MSKTLRYSNTGFTLIELMIVVVIVGVLTLVAYPAYQSFVIKANRASAMSYLLDAAQMQQLYFNDSRTYAENANELNSTVPDRVFKNYVVTFDVVTLTAPPQFTITADPATKIPATIQKNDGILTIDNQGRKEHAGESW